jgi:hypothetical protein
MLPTFLLQAIVFIPLGYMLGVRLSNFLEGM